MGHVVISSKRAHGPWISVGLLAASSLLAVPSLLMGVALLWLALQDESPPPVWQVMAFMPLLLVPALASAIGWLCVRSGRPRVAWRWGLGGLACGGTFLAVSALLQRILA